VYSAPLPRDLALPVGVGGDGQPVALPLRNLGNVLVAGLPGGGKSELLASMIAGLLRQDATGQRVQIAAIDTKLVTFGNLPALAALYAPPALEIDDAHALTEALLAEVRERFQRLHAAGTRSVEEYQARTGETLAYIVALIDELADLTSDSDRRRGAAWLAAATEIGRKGRAAGVSLVMATQRPSSDVIPSSLRNLAGAAVAFRLARADDSRLVLDAAGAEMLPATPGRCLVRHRDTAQAQAYFAGLEGGRFDQFCAALPAPGWPVRETGIPAQPSPQPGIPVGIPVFGTEQTGDYTLEQVAHIRQRHAALGSLKAVQREIYGQEGGYWFYRIRDAVEAGR
jgi:S-DNA-T family DNA segregation ATPase FtsK/SpoIIIE